MDASKARFHQVMLSQAQLASGLVRDPHLPAPPPDAEPVPWEPFAVIGSNPDDLAARWNLEFQDTIDGLDHLKLAVIDLPCGIRIALKRHHGLQDVGTLLDIDPCQLIDPKLVRRNLHAAVDLIHEGLHASIVDALGLTSDDLAWVRPYPSPGSAT